MLHRFRLRFYATQVKLVIARVNKTFELALIHSAIAIYHIYRSLCKHGHIRVAFVIEDSSFCKTRGVDKKKRNAFTNKKMDRNQKHLHDKYTSLKQKHLLFQNNFEKIIVNIAELLSEDPIKNLHFNAIVADFKRACYLDKEELKINIKCTEGTEGNI